MKHIRIMLKVYAFDLELRKGVIENQSCLIIVNDLALAAVHTVVRIVFVG